MCEDEIRTIVAAPYLTPIDRFCAKRVCKLWARFLADVDVFTGKQSKFARKSERALLRGPSIALSATQYNGRYFWLRIQREFRVPSYFFESIDELDTEAVRIYRLGLLECGDNSGFVPLWQSYSTSAVENNRGSILLLARACGRSGLQAGIEDFLYKYYADSRLTKCLSEDVVFEEISLGAAECGHVHLLQLAKQKMPTVKFDSEAILRAALINDQPDTAAFARAEVSTYLIHEAARSGAVRCFTSFCSMDNKAQLKYLEKHCLLLDALASTSDMFHFCVQSGVKCSMELLRQILPLLPKQRKFDLFTTQLCGYMKMGGSVDQALVIELIGAFCDKSFKLVDARLTEPATTLLSETTFQNPEVIAALAFRYALDLVCESGFRFEGLAAEELAKRSFSSFLYLLPLHSASFECSQEQMLQCLSLAIKHDPNWMDTLLTRNIAALVRRLSSAGSSYLLLELLARDPLAANREVFLYLISQLDADGRLAFFRGCIKTKSPDCLNLFHNALSLEDKTASVHEAFDSKREITFPSSPILGHADIDFWIALILEKGYGSFSEGWLESIPALSTLKKAALFITNMLGFFGSHSAHFEVQQPVGHHEFISALTIEELEMIFAVVLRKIDPIRLREFVLVFRANKSFHNLSAYAGEIVANLREYLEENSDRMRFWLGASLTQLGDYYCAFSDKARKALIDANSLDFNLNLFAKIVGENLIDPDSVDSPDAAREKLVHLCRELQGAVLAGLFSDWITNNSYLDVESLKDLLTPEQKESLSAVIDDFAIDSTHSPFSKLLGSFLGEHAFDFDEAAKARLHFTRFWSKLMPNWGTENKALLLSKIIRVMVFFDQHDPSSRVVALREAVSEFLDALETVDLLALVLAVVGDRNVGELFQLRECLLSSQHHLEAISDLAAAFELDNNLDAVALLMIAGFPLSDNSDKLTLIMKFKSSPAYENKRFVRMLTSVYIFRGLS